MAKLERLAVLAISVLILAGGCATGRPISLSGSLLPPCRALPPDNVLPRVAVLDFDFPAGDNAVIGRDYDNVRPILWRGGPGAEMADLVASALAGKGVPVVRVALAGHVPGGVLVTVRGRLDEFRVSAKRVHSVKVESAARVSLTLFAEGDAVPPGWRHGPVTSEVWASEPFFVTPDGVREALAAAADGAAGEAASRLMELRGLFGPDSR